MDDEYRFAVYKTTKEEGIYDFAGIVAVYSDEGNDPVPAVPVPTIQASVTESDELIAKTGYYYANRDHLSILSWRLLMVQMIHISVRNQKTLLISQR